MKYRTTLVAAACLLATVGTATAASLGKDATALDPAFSFSDNDRYRVYDTLAKFDERTGAPVYWLFAGRMHCDETYVYCMEPHADEIRLYIVPRNSVVGLTAHSSPGTKAVFTNGVLVKAKQQYMK